MAERRSVLLGLALASCTPHGDFESHAEPIAASSVLEPDRFAWVDEFELPRVTDDDLASRFAAAAIECSPAEPWQPSALELVPSSLADFNGLTLLYGDRPGVAGFNAAIDVPLDAAPVLSAPRDAAVFPSTLRWSAEGRAGFERITWSSDNKPSRIDGFDAEGRWRRTALFQHGPELTRRVEFVVDEGAPVRARTYVFERHTELLLTVVEHDQLAYRRWRVDRGSKSVVFEQHPDRVVRRAQIYERGVPFERVDVVASPPP